jgi:hypothetical protein
MDLAPQIPFRGRSGSHPPEDSFFENLLSDFDHQDFEETFSKLDRFDFLELIKTDFENFLKGCHWNLSSKGEKSYDYFNYILQRFKLQKGITFSEVEGKVYHSIVGEITSESDGPFASAYYQYEYINMAISSLEIHVKRLTPVISIDNGIATNSRIKTQRLHGFRIKNRDNLKTAYDRLLYNRLIHEDVKFIDFERAFTDWIPENKIIWLGGPGLLSYFIKSINGKGIEDEKKNIWITAINCFQDKNLNDFTVEQLRFAKKPTKTEDVDLVIKSINKYSGA